jgi:hypothetical protein
MSLSFTHDIELDRSQGGPPARRLAPPVAKLFLFLAPRADGLRLVACR